jgi:hypothetical protein
MRDERENPGLPNMPARNPWLTDSVYPVSHVNSAATDAVPFPGPTGGKKLSRDEVTAVPVLFVSNPTIKKVGTDVIVLAPGTLGLQKIIATGDAFELVTFLPYPGLEERARRVNNRAIATALNEIDAARREGDDARLAAAPELLAKLGLDFKSGVNGIYNLIDKDGFHYCVYGGTKVLKTTDDNIARGPLRVIRAVDVTQDLAGDLAGNVTRIIGAAMTYDGFIAVVAPGALVILDRDLEIKDAVGFGGETIDNGVAVDEKGGVYVVTSRRMRKVVWNGKKLSMSEEDGAWESEYNTPSGDEARAMGAVSRGSGTTPTLMGFGDDPHKLVVIADADPHGTNAVAFWRDDIPEGFAQKAGTKSRRIADQIRIDISKLTIEPSPEVLGYGVAFLNSTFPRPTKIPGLGNAFVSGVTRPAPLGIQKFVWNPDHVAFEKAWTNEEIDNTDALVPSISAATGEMYVAHKEHGDYQYVGLDWKTGAIKDRWEFPDDSRAWNGFGGIATILENADLMIGGVFALKRVHVGNVGAGAGKTAGG